MCLVRREAGFPRVAAAGSLLALFLFVLFFLLVLYYLCMANYEFVHDACIFPIL